MRIAIPFPEYPDSFQENVAVTLREMGHEVISPPAGSRFSRNLAGRAFEYAARSMGWSYAPPLEKWLVGSCREHHIDLVLALTQQLEEETIRDVRRSGVRHVVAWWGDPPANMTRRGLFTPGWDLLLFKDRNAVADFRRAGFEAHLLHEAMNPKWHRPIASRQNDALIVAGNWYGLRQALVARLVRDGHLVHGYGPPLPGWGDPALRPIHRGRFIVREEKSRVFGEGLACFNSTSLAEGASLNCRAFEVAGAGGLQLIEANPVIPECFEPGRELLVYDTYEDICDHIARAKRDQAEMVKIREAGARRAVAEHTYRHRLERIFELLA